MKSPFALFDGQLVREKKPQLLLLDSAYLYGIGAFETFRIIRGRVLFVKEHLRRLKNTLRFIRLPLPFSQREFERGVATLLKANRIREAYLRLMVSGDEAHLGSGGGTKPFPTLHWSLLCRPFSGYPKQLYRQGARLVLVQSVRNDPQPMSQAKVTNYLTKMIARKECAARHADEGVLLSHEGRVTECTSSNLFVVTKGKVITPPLSEGLMPGITRHVILKLCKKLHLPALERPLLLRHLKEADELFITSTLKDVMPVKTFEGRVIGRKLPGPITKQLQQAFQQAIS